MNWAPLRQVILPLFLVSLFVFTGCTTIPETGRTALQFIPEGYLSEMSETSFREIKTQVKRSRSRSLNARVQRVGERIVRSAIERGADLPPPEEWEFVVFDDDQENAFAMPGGKVGFYTGILKLMNTDDDIAIVMGHEVAHVVAGHGNERLSTSLAITGVGLYLNYKLDEKDDKNKALFMQAFGLGAQLGQLSFSRGHESEADHMGLIYAANAGYDPRAAIPFWKRMASGGGSNVPEFLSTHPSGETRIIELERLMPKAMEIYNYKKSKRAQLGPIDFDLYDPYLTIVADSKSHTHTH